MSLTFIEVNFQLKSLEFDVNFHLEDSKFRADFGKVQPLTQYVGGELYNGDYSVIPKFEAQTLKTANRVLINDVIVDEIPYAEVTNTSGGITVTIG